MSFTGKATYAELYPNHLLSGVVEKTYGQGAVFRAHSGQYFLLAQLGRGMFLILLASGNRWKDECVPTCKIRPNRCVASQILEYLDCDHFEYVGASRIVLAINADEDDS